MDEGMMRSRESSLGLTYFWLATEPPPASTAGLLDAEPGPFFLLPELIGAKPPVDEFPGPLLYPRCTFFVAPGNYGAVKLVFGPDEFLVYCCGGPLSRI